MQGIECLFGGGSVPVGCSAYIIAECSLGEAVLDAGVGIDDIGVGGGGMGRRSPSGGGHGCAVR